MLIVRFLSLSNHTYIGQVGLKFDISLFKIMIIILMIHAGWSVSSVNMSVNGCCFSFRCK